MYYTVLVGGDMIKKQTVHNIAEIKALVKESYAQGAELKFDQTEWYSHSGKRLAKTHVYDTEFEVVVEDVESLDGYRSIIIDMGY